MYLMKRGKQKTDAIDPANEKYDYTDVAYWRKANEIHDWFLRRLELDDGFNCEYAEVTKEDLEALIEDCTQVLSEHSLAEEILPTRGGFFFGSTDYDEYYFQDLIDTIDQLNKVISETDWDNDVICYSCWW